MSKSRQKTLVKSATSVCSRIEDLLLTANMRDSLYKRKVSVQSNGVERR
jgi:hypothetical protein